MTEHFLGNNIRQTAITATATAVLTTHTPTDSVTVTGMLTGGTHFACQRNVLYGVGEGVAWSEYTLNPGSANETKKAPKIKKTRTKMNKTFALTSVHGPSTNIN